MSTPGTKTTSTPISEKIRTGLTRPGLACAALAAIGLGVAGASAGASPAAAAPATSGSPALATVAQTGDLATHVKRDGDDRAERGGRDHDKRGDRDDKSRRDDRGKRDGDRKGRPAWVSPMPDAKTTSCFGPRWGTQHKGLDLALPENAPVHAAGAGTVAAAGWTYQGYGISVVVDHGDGHLTHYAHLNRTTVRTGDHVKPGDRIGFEGNTGDSTGPHLHFEVHKGMWNQLNPGPWMKERGVDLKC